MKNILLLLSAFAALTAYSQNDLIPYRKGDLWGYCTADKKVVIEPRYKDADMFTGNMAVVESDSGKTVIDRSGKQLLPWMKNGLFVFSNGELIHVYGPSSFQHKLYGSNAQAITSDWVDEIRTLGNGCLTVSMRGKRAVIDKSGKELHSCSDCYYEMLPNKMILFGDYSHKGYFNPATGKEIARQYEKAYPFYEGLAMVRKNGKWGFVDSLGNNVIPFEYEKAIPDEEESNGSYNESTYKGFNYDGFSEGLAVVGKNEKYGFIDKQGKEIIPFLYDKAYGFRNGYAWVRKGDKWGMIDKKGKEVIPCIYTSIVWLYDKELSGLPFVREGLMNVRKDTLEGFVNMSGKEVIPVKYQHTSPFVNGIAVVRQNNKYGAINTKGETVIPFIYEWIEETGSYEGPLPFETGYAIALLNDKWVLIDNNGKQLSKMAFDSDNKYIYFDDFGYSQASVNGNTYLINTKGEVIYDGGKDNYLSVRTPELLFDYNKKCLVNFKTKVVYAE